MEFLGYERSNGQAGIRNYVCILPTTSCANEMACAIADGAAGAVPLLHNYGCLRLKPDNDRAHRTLVGLGCNPNIAGVVLLGIGCGTLDPEGMAQEIAARGTPVELVTITGAGGYQKAIESGRAAARAMVAQAALQQRVPLSLGKLSVGVKCGGSATISSAAGHPVTGHVVDTVIDHGDLEEEAQAWERGVDELANTDEDVAEYVSALESAQDTSELPEASGDAIAKEFERYLRRRGDDTSGPA